MQDEKEMRQVYCDCLLELAEKDKNIVVIEADLMNCIKTERFKAAFPERFFNVGIAEANMVGIAAGLSTCGKIPFISSFAPFATRRCYDQIFISVAYSKQNVKIVGTDPGISAEVNGGTHMPFEDMGIMRLIPDCVCVEPTDSAMLRSLMPQIAAYKGLVYIRLFRKKTEKIFEDGESFDLFKARSLKEGKDVTIVASGIMVGRALQAAEQLKAEGIDAGVLNTYTWKPIDSDALVSAAKASGAVVVAENHNTCGGLTSAVTQALCAEYPVPVLSVGVNDKFGEVGKMPYLSEVYHMNAGDIVERCKQVIALKK